MTRRISFRSAATVAFMLLLGVAPGAADDALVAVNKQITIVHEAGDGAKGSDGAIEFDDIDVQVEHGDWQARTDLNDNKNATFCLRYVAGTLADSSALQVAWTGVTINGQLVGIKANGKEVKLKAVRGDTDRVCKPVALSKMRDVVRVVLRHKSVKKNKDVDGIYFCLFELFRSVNSRSAERRTALPFAAPAPRG